MKYGVREICDVVLKAKATQKVGNKVFYKNEPVIYFDTLKTSSLEGAATTVYAQGGQGNARLMAWEGERTVTYTMEDALISPAGFMILSGAGLIDASEDTPIYVHSTEQIVLSKTENSFSAEADVVSFELGEEPAILDDGDYIYVMLLDESGSVSTEPYIATGTKGSKKITLKGGFETSDDGVHDLSKFKENATVLVDYYIMKTGGAQQIDISADKFGGNYYLEASTLFKNTDGVDVPAEFIIPNCKIQSNFTFTMASSGDPSTFTFTMDAFPDYTRFNKKKKVLAALQIMEGSNDESLVRTQTVHAAADEVGLD